MDPVPSVPDFQADPAAATVAAGTLAQATSADGDATTQALAWGIAAKILATAAPLVGEAIGGPLGALAGQAVGTAATSLASQHADAVATLDAGQQALINEAIAVGAAVVADKINPPPIPVTIHT